LNRTTACRSGGPNPHRRHDTDCGGVCDSRSGLCNPHHHCICGRVVLEHRCAQTRSHDRTNGQEVGWVRVGNGWVLVHPACVLAQPCSAVLTFNRVEAFGLSHHHKESRKAHRSSGRTFGVPRRCSSTAMILSLMLTHPSGSVAGSMERKMVQSDHPPSTSSVRRSPPTEHHFQFCARCAGT